MLRRPWVSLLNSTYSHWRPNEMPTFHQRPAASTQGCAAIKGNLPPPAHITSPCVSSVSPSKRIARSDSVNANHWPPWCIATTQPSVRRGFNMCTMRDSRPPAVGVS